MTSPPPPPSSSGPSRYLPHPAIQGWVMTSAAEIFSQDQLPDLVGDESGSFVRQGVTQAAAAGYRAQQLPDLALRIEIFSTSSHLEAFGVLSEELALLGDPVSIESPGVIEIGEAGLMRPGRLGFVRGSVYARLLLSDESPGSGEERLEEATREHLPPLGRALHEVLPGASGLPEALSSLPRVHRVRRTERYHPGKLPPPLESLSQGLTSLYGDPGPRFLLALPLGLDESGARGAMSHLEELTTERQPVEDLGEEAFAGQTSQGQEIQVARRGNRLAVAVGSASSARPRASLVRQVMAAALDPGGEPQGEVDPRPWRRRQSSPAAAPRDSGIGSAHTR